MNTTPTTLHAAIALAALGACAFGCKGIAVKLAYAAGGTPDTTLVWRLLIAAPCFAAIVWRERRRAQMPWTAADLAAACCWGIVGFHLASWVNFLGLERIGAGLERIVLFVYPVLVVLGSALRDGRAPSRSLIAAAATTWAGVAIAWWHHARLGDADALGVVLVAVSAAIFAWFMVGSERMLKRVGHQAGLGVGMLAAAVGMIVHALAIHGPSVLHLPSPAMLGWCIVLALGCTVVPVVLQAQALPVLGAARLAVVSTVGPIATLVLAWITLGESPGLLGAVGAAITIAGGLWCALGKK